MGSIASFVGSKQGWSPAKQRDIDRGKQTGSAEAPTITRTSSTPGLDLVPNNTPQYDRTGRLLSDGTSPYVANPSAGQIIGNLAGISPVVGTINTLGGVVGRLLSGEDQVSSNDGGAIGRLIDGARGVAPGQVTGYTGNRVASSTNTRGTRAADDTRVIDRAGSMVAAAISGTGVGTTDLFSDVALQDRRKPYRKMTDEQLLEQF